MSKFINQQTFNVASTYFASQLETEPRYDTNHDIENPIIPSPAAYSGQFTPAHIVCDSLSTYWDEKQASSLLVYYQRELGDLW